MRCETPSASYLKTDPLNGSASRAPFRRKRALKIFPPDQKKKKKAIIHRFIGGLKPVPDAVAQFQGQRKPP